MITARVLSLEQLEEIAGEDCLSAMLSDFGVSRIFGAGFSREVNVTKTIISDGKTESKLILRPKEREILPPSQDNFSDERSNEKTRVSA